MDKELVQKWTEALRSGKYEQGRMAMKKYVDGCWRYCCLGVLCEVAGVYQDKLDEETVSFMDAKKNWTSSSLTPRMLRDFGIAEGTMFELINMNDAKKSFDEIALYIEYTYNLKNSV